MDNPFTDKADQTPAAKNSSEKQTNKIISEKELKEAKMREQLISYQKSYNNFPNPSFMN